MKNRKSHTLFILAEGKMASGPKFLLEVKPHNGNILSLRTSLFDFGNCESFSVVGSGKRALSLYLPSKSQ